MNSVDQRLRVKRLRCFLWSEPELDGFTAICLDLNLHAFAPTRLQAKQRLNEAIRNGFEAYADDLESWVNQKPSSTLMWMYRRVKVSSFIERYLTSTLLGTYTEQAPTMAHAC